MKLLLNRGVGLYLAHDKLQEESEKSDHDSAFILRNFHKASIAIGDAVLMTNDGFHHSYVERARVLDEYSYDVVSPMIKKIYKDAIDYKLHPTLWFDRNLMQQMYDEIIGEFTKTYLMIASFYTEVEYETFYDFYKLYVSQNKKNVLKNIALNIKYFSMSGIQSWGRSYPRERLYFAFPELLLNNAGIYKNKVYNTIGCSSLKKSDAFRDRFLAMWRRFN